MLFRIKKFAMRSEPFYLNRLTAQSNKIELQLPHAKRRKHKRLSHSVNREYQQNPPAILFCLPKAVIHQQQHQTFRRPTCQRSNVTPVERSVPVGCRARAALRSAAPAPRRSAPFRACTLPVCRGHCREGPAVSAASLRSSVTTGGGVT